MATATKKTDADSDADIADLNAQIDALRNDLVGLKEILTDLGKAKGDEAVNTARAKAAEARDKLSEQADAARQQAAELQGQANEFIHKQPATALGIAAGLGFLVGFLGSRK